MPTKKPPNAMTRMPNAKGNEKSEEFVSSKVNADAKQETTEYQEMQENFLQNLIKAYMMIKQTGNRR